jgi:hypothetical protein
MRPLDERGRTRWIAIATLAVIALGLAQAMRQTGVLKPNTTSGTPEPGDAVIRQALGQVARPAPATPPPTADTARIDVTPAHPETAMTMPMGTLPPGHPAIGGGPAIDSTAIKQRWVNEVRGVDVSMLDPDMRTLFVRFANARQCTCGCGYTLAGCKASDMTCEVSGAALEALRDSIRLGRIVTARGIRERPRAGQLQ